MLFPILLRPARRLVITTLLPTRPSHITLRPFLLAKRWNSTSAAAVTVEELSSVEDSIESPDSPQVNTEEIDEHIKRLPLEARELLTREYPLIHEFIGPSQSHLLTLTLQPYLNFSDIEKPETEDGDAPHNPFTIKNMLPFYGQRLPPGFHFVYFNGYTQEYDLSSDGYIASQGPGGAWTRRMWAGGKLNFQPLPEKRLKGNDRGARRARALDIGRRALCHESIEDIQMKGEPGSDNEMMFVYIKRKLWAEGYIVKEPTKSPKMKDIIPEEEALRVLPDEEVPLIEQRCLVYMKEKPAAAATKSDKKDGNQDTDVEAKSSTSSTSKEITPTSKMSSRAEKADFSHTFIPSTTLLFRYSALTFNAHKIHIDNHYAKGVEGHRNLIVHGPLVLTFLLELLRNQTLGLEKQYKMNTFEYRNIAPLYVDEPIHLYGRWSTDAPAPERAIEVDPREKLVPMYDEMDSLRKSLAKLAKDQETPEEERIALKKDLRGRLRTLKKESEKLEKFKPVEPRDIEYRTYELWAENNRGQVAVRGTVLLEDLPPKVELTPEQQWKKYQAEMARNKRMAQKQQMRAHKDMIRMKRRERKLKLRQAQMEREKERRAEKERLWREAKEAILRGEEPPSVNYEFKEDMIAASDLGTNRDDKGEVYDDGDDEYDDDDDEEYDDDDLEYEDGDEDKDGEEDGEEDGDEEDGEENDHENDAEKNRSQDGQDSKVGEGNDYGGRDRF
ncbi:hypothetical protein ABW20_dc0104144 [Dactylellina cionopaga]|nr:hypothetical protein ABW20_dc0104144 [Dactylellina cionopaga]